MIIFLDIDGVLNQLQGNYYLDDRCIDRLSKICNSIDGRVVLTSSWRIGYTNLGRCTPQIENLKQKFKDRNIEIIGRTEKLNNRAIEIESYINKYKVSDYIILDDDRAEFKSDIKRFGQNIYIVNGRMGLTDSDVNKIINLKSKSIRKKK